jgi:hypothetical protein
MQMLLLAAVLGVLMLPVDATALPLCGHPPPSSGQCISWQCQADGTWDVILALAGTKCGQQGTCNEGGQCIEPPIVPGTIFPKWQVVAVRYAPPASLLPGAPVGVVQYSKGAAYGTTSSSSASFLSDMTVTNNSSFSMPGGSIDATFSVGATWGTTRSDQKDEVISLNTFDQVRGATDLDGIDHGYDQIVLWLNPQVDAAFQGSRVSFSVHPVDGHDPELLWVTVRELLNPYTVMAPAVYDRLVNQLGMPVSDFTEILKADPFAYGQNAIDPNRFVDLHTNFVWRPPDSMHCNQVQAITGANWTQQEIVSTGTTVNHSTSVGFTVSASASFLNILTQKLAVSGKWTWTNSSSVKASVTTNAAINVSVAQPSCGYTGPLNVKVFQDKIYHTYLFATAY